ncbi:MAG: PTS sugar transporter subunit IIA [Planctomycetota bacterium]|jgi:mannitol/fructose-specific phosphotransferase system IIA component (Ntr-type)
MTISLENIIPAERTVLLDAETKDDALRDLGAVVAGAPEVVDAAGLLAAIFEREQIMSTGIGLGIAIPHAKIPSVTDFVVGFGKVRGGLDFNSLDGKPVHFIVMIAGPHDQQERYLQLLARITLKLKDAAVRRRLSEADDVEGILEALR